MIEAPGGSEYSADEFRLQKRFTTSISDDIIPLVWMVWMNLYKTIHFALVVWPIAFRLVDACCQSLE